MPYSNPTRILILLVAISTTTVFAREFTTSRESNSSNLRGNTHFDLSTDIGVAERETTHESLNLRGTVASTQNEPRLAAKHTHGDAKIENELPTSATTLTNDRRGLKHNRLERRHLKRSNSGSKNSKSDKKSAKSDTTRELPTGGENQSESLLPPIISNLVVENEGEVSVAVLPTIENSIDEETKEPLVAEARPIFFTEEELENSEPYNSEDPPRESVSVPENIPRDNVPVFNMEVLLSEDEIAESKENSGYNVKALEVFEDAIGNAGPEAASDSLQIAYGVSNFRAPKHISPVGCPGDVKLLKQRGDRFSMAFDPIVDAIEVVQQSTSTVTVDLHQVWKNNDDNPIDHFYYYFHKPGKRFWGNAKCYEEKSVPYSVTEKVDTVEIVCNVHQPYAEIEICLVDESSNGSMVPSEEDAIIPTKCQHEKSSTELSVCYTLEISCSSTCR